MPCSRTEAFLGRRNASDEAPSRRLSDQLDELETASSLNATVPEDLVKSFDPVARSKGRKTQLPRSRYVSALRLRRVKSIVLLSTSRLDSLPETQVR